MKNKTAVLALFISAISLYASAHKAEKTPDYAAIFRQFQANYSKGLVEASGDMVDPKKGAAGGYRVCVLFS